MRKEIKKHLMGNVRNTEVLNNYVDGGKIRFNKEGLGKALSSASNADKLGLLEYSPKLSEKATSLPISYSDRNIRTFIVPVKKMGKNSRSVNHRTA